MRVWLLLLLIPFAQGALLDDATGDVAINHCETAQTPIQGVDAMDLVSLDVNETPSDISFTVGAVGLEEEAGPDSGNYFVHFRRGENHYAVRMFQEISGTAAIAHLIASEGVSIFGPVIAELPADVEATTNTISTAVPRGLLIDHDGAIPIRGHALSDLMVSAEAHATGAYFCNFDGTGGGPAIIEDRAPDSFDPADGANLVFQYGGGSATGPMNLTVERPFRASNGEATTYAFNITVTNDDAAAHNYTVATKGLPSDWQFIRPNGTLHIPAGGDVTFTGYAVVPFQHVHGATTSFDILVESQSGDAKADAQVGVHYLRVAQPSGHHPDVFLHSVPPLGLTTAFSEAMGGGGNHLFWNTLSEDDTDHGLPMASQSVDGDIVWYGCLAPGLALGLSPALNTTGTFDLTFSSDEAIKGELTGAIRVVTPEKRGATCHDARQWPAGETILTIPATPVTISGTTNVEGIIELAFSKDIAHRQGADLLLEIRIAGDSAGPFGGAVDLMPGGQLRLPLADHHEPVPEIVLQGGAQGTPGFVEEPAPIGKKSPAMALPLALAALVLAMRRQ